MLSPLPRLRPGTTIAEPVTTATATTATTAFDSRTSHRMRTRNIARRGHVHTLLAAERIIARTRPRRCRMRGAGTALLWGALRITRSVRGIARPRTRRIAATGVGMLPRTRLLATLGTRVATIATVITTLRTIRPATLLGALCGMRSRMRSPRLRHLHMSGAGLHGSPMFGMLTLRFLGMLSMLSRTWSRLGCALLLLTRLILRIRFREGCFQTANDRRLHRRGCGLDELPHVLELLKDGFAVNAKFLGQFIYALFCHSVFSYSVTARICAVTLR